MAVFERHPDGSLRRVQMTARCGNCGGKQDLPDTARYFSTAADSTSISQPEPASAPGSDVPAAPTDDTAQPVTTETNEVTDDAS